MLMDRGTEDAAAVGDAPSVRYRLSCCSVDPEADRITTTITYTDSILCGFWHPMVPSSVRPGIEPEPTEPLPTELCG